MTSVSVCYSLFEGFLWKLVGSRVQQGLVGGLSSPEGVEVDLSGLQIDFGSDEPMNPIAIDEELVTQHTDLSPVVGAADINQDTFRMFLQIQLPVFGERSPRGSRFDPRGVFLPRGYDVPGRAFLEAAERAVLESRPDSDLPAAVEALDGRLKARFVGRHKHRGDTQAQAEPRDTADHVGELLGTAEAVVVVELAVSRKSHLAPMLHQQLDDRSALHNQNGV